MTEEEWHGRVSAYGMYEFVRRWAGNRKLRLYGCACCCGTWELLTDARSRQAVEVSERYADGDATREEMSAAQDRASAAYRTAVERLRPFYPAALRGFPGLDPGEREASEAKWEAACRECNAAKAAKCVARATGRIKIVAEEMGLAAGWALIAEIIGRGGSTGLVVQNRQASLLRCIIGNPFRRINTRPAWWTAGVLEIARDIYLRRAFERLPNLADALLASGCEDDEVIRHCRSHGPHVRGCWAVDKVLGRF
jgi:hypothetical protein